MKSIKLAAATAIVIIGIAGCSTAAGGGGSSEDSVRSAAPESSAPVSNGVPGALQEAAADAGLSISPTGASVVPGLGTGKGYAVYQDKDLVGRILVKTGQSKSTMSKQLGAITGKLSKAVAPVQTARGTFKVVQLPIGMTAAAAFDSTFVVLQAQTTDGIKSLAKVAQGI